MHQVRTIIRTPRRRWAFAAAAAATLAAIAVSVAAVALPTRQAADRGASGGGGTWVPVAAVRSSDQLLARGKLSPIRTVAVTAAAAGEAAELHVAAGDEVRAGQPLLRISSPELESRVRAAEAAALRARAQDGALSSGEEPSELLSARRRFAQAQAQSISALRKVEDARLLLERGFIARNEAESATADAENAQQQIALARDEIVTLERKYSPEQRRAAKLEDANRVAEIGELLQRKGQLFVRAPIAGVVQSLESQASGDGRAPKELTQGARVENGMTLMTIADTSSYLVNVQTSAADLTWLETGLEAEVRLAALPQRVLIGKVQRIAPPLRSSEAALGATSFEALVAFPLRPEDLTAADRQRLRIGGVASVTIRRTSEQTRTSIPIDAVVWGSQGEAQVRWRAGSGETGAMRSVNLIRADAHAALVAERLDGEVWIPAASAADASSAEKPGRRAATGVPAP
jgi:multidrug resistance efflux pump